MEVESSNLVKDWKSYQFLKIGGPLVEMQVTVGMGGVTTVRCKMQSWDAMGMSHAHDREHAPPWVWKLDVMLMAHFGLMPLIVHLMV